MNSYSTLLKPDYPPACIVTIFDECNSADVCYCNAGSTRVTRVIARIYDAETNSFLVIESANSSTDDVISRKFQRQPLSASTYH